MKKKKSKISLKWRLFSYFSVFTVVLLVILWVCLTLLLDTIYRQIKTDSLKKCTNEIAHTLKYDLYESDVQELARTYDVNIKIVDSNYETVFEYAVSPTNVVTRISGTDLFMLCERAVENGGEYIQPFHQFIKDTHNGEKNDTEQNTDTFGEQDNRVEPDIKRGGEHYNFIRGKLPVFANNQALLNLISARTAVLPDGAECYIIVDSVITPVNATVRTLVVMLLYISVFTLIFAIVIAFLLAKRISKPIVSMNKNARRLAKGDYSVKFESRGYAEIEELNDTMNYAAKELSKADELKNELIANVSHDLRTPLTMIIGYGEVMRDIPGENSPENVQAIMDEATRLSLLVNDLLDISKLQSGTSDVTKETFNLTETVRNIISRFDRLNEHGGYNIVFDASEDVYINADERRISQVVYNLITNAINYTGCDRKVIVKQKELSGKVRIEVTDNGEGIAKEDLPYIWNRYYRIDKKHIRAVVGTGLGLSIVKTVLESHGAVYGVDSTPGVGSTFWFELDMEQNNKF
ncbi:MAG: HAMP domain-containing histidine kinase [Clostridia bacterium]|nr:HAMP domain-containing histidine kinase [Clostridia bacterium]